MPPPAVISGVIRKPVLIMEHKIVMIRTVLFDKGSLGIAFLAFINPFPIQPLVKRAAVIEHTVNNNAHPSSVGLSLIHISIRLRNILHQIGILVHQIRNIIKRTLFCIFHIHIIG